MAEELTAGTDRGTDMTDRREFRSSQTGQFVTDQYGQAHPDVTQNETLQAAAVSTDGQCTQNTSTTNVQCRRSGTRACPDCGAWVCEQHYQADHADSHGSA